MSTQTKASFAKESLSFFRTGRFFIVAAVIVGLVVFIPLLIGALAMFMEAASDIYADMGMDVTEMTDMLNSSSLALVNATTTMSQLGLMVLLILLSRAAGGEQKKRTMVIPKSSGLRGFSYLLPKYILYPISSFILGFLGLLAAHGVSSFMFEQHDVFFLNSVFAALLMGATLALYVSFHLTLGTSTGQSGLSATVCIIAAVILPFAFDITGGAHVFNPFAMSNLAAATLMNSAITSVQMLDILYTILFAIGIIVISFLIALFAQNARKIDNSGNDMEL